jgi:hypothetical protein
MTYAEAMHRYGSDKPDLRVKLEFTELTDAVKDVDFKVFSGPANTKAAAWPRCACPAAPDDARRDRRLHRVRRIYGAKGLAYIKVNDATKGQRRPAVADRQEPARSGAAHHPRAHRRAVGDLIFFGADKAKVVNDALGALRMKIGHERLRQSRPVRRRWAPLWVVDFPMFEYDEEDQALDACTTRSPAPRTARGLLAPIRASAWPRPTTWCSTAGSSAAARCVSTAPTCRQRSSRRSNIGARRAAGQVRLPARRAAVRRAAARRPGLRPRPHRHLMTGAESIRDVIAFPKTQRAQCLLTDAPSPVDEKQLRELHIRLRASRRWTPTWCSCRRCGCSTRARHATSTAPGSAGPTKGQAEFLAPEGYEVAYRTNAVTRHGEHGNALLSRWPLGDVGHHDVSDHRFEQRGLLHVPVLWQGTTVHALVAHLGLIHSSRVRQVQRLAEASRPRCRPALRWSWPVTSTTGASDWTSRCAGSA